MDRNFQSMMRKIENQIDINHGFAKRHRSPPRKAKVSFGNSPGRTKVMSPIFGSLERNEKPPPMCELTPAQSRCQTSLNTY